VRVGHRTGRRRLARRVRELVVDRRHLLVGVVCGPFARGDGNRSMLSTIHGDGTRAGIDRLANRRALARVNVVQGRPNRDRASRGRENARAVLCP
jgi:hypothetical protein